MKMVPSALITAVVVNWNKCDSVLHLLDSLAKIDIAINVIVVDNASNDGSCAAIRHHSLPHVLLENGENLGGAGGFNTGIRYALNHLQQDYFWLLDNDAEVEPGTLQPIIDVMVKDRTIGVTGSCILSPEDHSLIVEAGGFADKSMAAWRPNRRYERYDEIACRHTLEDVDYVPACSAVIRSETVRRIGILDERFFLHWDDIDFCARVREEGSRVVSLFASRVYHGAEKGYSPVTLYYDFRNALLFQAKHRRGTGLMLSLWGILGNYLSSMAYFFLLGQGKLAAYLYSALRDFMRRRFGRASVSPAELGAPASTGRMIDYEQLRRFRKVLLFAVGSFDDVAAAIRGIRDNDSSTSITVAVAADRAEVYRLPEVDALIRFDLFRSGIRGSLATAMAIMRGGFHCGITAGGPFIVPYAFLLRRNLHFDRRENVFRRSGASLFTLWKVPLAMLAGKFLAAFFLAPVAWVCRGLRDGSRDHPPELPKYKAGNGGISRA